MAMSISPHHDHLDSFTSAQQRQRTVEQLNDHDAQSAVLSHPGLLKDVLRLTGPGQHFYVSTVCSHWRATYTLAMQGLRNSRRLRVKLSMTSYGAVFTSESSFKLAVEHGSEHLRDPSVQQAAGQYADLDTLRLAAVSACTEGLSIRESSLQALRGLAICRNCSHLWATNLQGCQMG